MQIAIRDATVNDLPFLVQCNRQMAAETEDNGLDEAVLSKGIGYLLQNPDEGFYLVAQDISDTNNPKKVGTLMVTFEWSDWRNGRFWWIQSVYVEADARKNGIYRALHQEVRKRTKGDAQACGIRLYVEKDNHNAMATYRAMSMHETHYRLFEEIF